MVQIQTELTELQGSHKFGGILKSFNERYRSS
jgi:hypothetical protein